MSYIDTLAEWFIDHKRTLPQRLAVILVIMFGIYTANDILSFSYFYRMNRKAELLEKLTKLITDEKTDSLGRAEAIALRHRIAKKEPSYFAFFNFLGKLVRPEEPKGANSTKTPPRITDTTKIAANVSMRNEFLFFISSSGLIVIVGIILIPFTLFNKTGDSFSQRLAGALLMTLTFAFASFAMYALMNLIPIILNDWAFNYILNAIFQIGSFAILIYLANRSSHIKAE